MPERLANKVLLIGWDAADWKTITPLMDAGLMPSLQGLVERGVMGNIATLDPPLSPMLWTSIATGKTADEHGVLGFVQPDEKGETIRPVLGTSRKAKAVWNIFNQSGLRSNVIGWWPSHPAEPINGAMVTNFYHRVSGHVSSPAPLPPNSVHPPEFTETLASLRIHAQELTGNHILPFVPLAAEIPDGDPTLGGVARTLAEAASVHQAATWLMEHSEWDFTAVYYDAIDHFGHGFMKYHPPRRRGIPKEAYDRYKGVVEAGYRFHDMMLGRLLELAGDDTTVILVSDHGFHSDHMRPMNLPIEPAGPAHEHRDFGVFVMAGPGVKQDDRVYGASLLDVAPTLLSLYGLPVGKDMVGKPLLTAFETPPAVEYVDSWEEIDGDDGRHADESIRDPWAEQEAMRQLIELGYIEPGQGAEEVEKTVRESTFYLARVHLFNGEPGKALPLLQEVFGQDPYASRYGVRLAEAQRELGRFDEAHETLEAVAEGRIELLTARIDALKELIEQRESDIEGATDDEEAPRDPKMMRAALDRFERMLATPPLGLNYHRGMVYLAEGKPDEALAEFQIVEQSASTQRFPALSVQVGEAFARNYRWDEAKAAFESALASDPEMPGASRGLALVHLRQGNPEKAAEHALDAIGLRYFYPAAHFHLGEALLQLEHYEGAAKALEVSVAQNPAIRRAHLYLADLYRIHLDDPAKADYHARFAAEKFAPVSQGE